MLLSIGYVLNSTQNTERKKKQLYRELYKTINFMILSVKSGMNIKIFPGFQMLTVVYTCIGHYGVHQNP